VFDWQCQLHPSHWKYRGMQKAEKANQAGKASRAERASQAGHPRAATRTEANEREVDMADVGGNQEVINE
jgi:hypothetical protein